MSRLINFGLGEICDRLALLHLKLLYGELQHVDVSAWRQERNALLPKLLARATGRWLEFDGELNAVHAALWLYEADLRVFKAQGQTRENTDEIVECAFRIQELYDRRASLIEQINGCVGDVKAAAEPAVN
jgi:hypothetical protein